MGDGQNIKISFR